MLLRGDNSHRSVDTFSQTLKESNTQRNTHRHTNTNMHVNKQTHRHINTQIHTQIKKTRVTFEEERTPTDRLTLSHNNLPHPLTSSLEFTL